MKKQVGFVLIFLIVGISLMIHLHQGGKSDFVPSPPIREFHGDFPEIESEESEIGSEENPQARSEYEQAMLVDPKTGLLPTDARRREMRFSAGIPKKVFAKSSLRTGEALGWNSIGPYNVGGRTRAVAIDNANEKVILAGGVSGGMWRSVNEGQDWLKTTVPSSIHSVTCIAQDIRPGKTNVWYYGTGEFTSNSASKKAAPFRGDGVFKSIDGGNTWSQLTSTAEGVPNYYNSQFQYVWKVLPNPKNLQDDEVFLATVGAIFRSVDGGASWDLVLGRKNESTPETDLNDADLSDYAEIAQTEDGDYYAVLSQSARSGSSPDRGVYRSTDGVNWVPLTPLRWPGNYNRTLIATSKSNPHEVFFSVDTYPEMLWKYTYLSGDGTDSGGKWTDLSANIPAFGGEVGDYNTQESYNMVLQVHPTKKDIVFLGGTNLYRSSDGFSTTQNTAWVGGYDTANNIKVLPNHFVDQHALAFYPSNPDRMLSSNDGGVFYTENNTAPAISWIPKNYGFVTSQFYTVGLDEFGVKSAVMGGLQDNGTLIANQPVDVSSWNAIIQGDGGYSAISKNAIYYFASFQFGKIYRFTLDKNLQRRSFARIDPYGSGGADKLLFVNPYVLAPENQNVMYFAGGDVIWRNSNVSQAPLFENYPLDINWEKMAGTEIMHGSGAVSAINASYNPSGVVYYGTTNGQVFRIKSAINTTFSVEEITSGIFPENAYVSSIAIDRKDSKTVVVSFSNYNVISVFYSQDGGDSFQNISGNLEENPDGSGSGPSVRWMEIVSKNQGEAQLFAATSTGIYSTNSINGNNTVWENEGSETIGNELVTMIKYFSGDGTIIAATHGNGMYESKLDDVWKIEMEDEIQHLAFSDAFPNPFHQTINIPFTIPHDGMVRARIYSSLGQLIKTILWADQYKGKNNVSWDGTNEAGVRVSSGLYICRLEYENQKIDNKLIFTH